jgi:two-component system NtrC family sensor kinase
LDIDRHTASGPEGIEAAEIAERLQWLLRLRWLIVPVFIAVDLVSALVVHRRAPWTTLVVGAVLIAANALYSYLLARNLSVSALLRWARFESALVTAVPVIVVVLNGDPTNALRYGVLVGVVGAAAVLPHTSEVAIVAMWAVCSLIVADAASFHFDPAFVDQVVVARWAMEAGIIVTVSAIAGHLHALRQAASSRLRSTAAQLVSAKGEWEAAFDGVQDMIFVTDPELRVVRGNRAFAKVVAARPHELAGRKLSELLAGHPDRWWTTPGDGIQEIEDPLFDTLFEVSTTRIGDRVVHVARDVGEQRRLYSRLVQADKLAAVGVLASGVAHEINNPTAYVTSNLTELKRYVAAYEAAIAEMTEFALQAGLADRMRALLARSDVAFARREAASSITESLAGMERVRQIVANLRSLARRDQAGEPAAAVDLGEVVNAVVRTASSQLRAAGARVDVRGPVHVLGHRGELVDVVLNLVVNAVQAKDEARPNEIGIALFREGSSAVVRVSDTGRGISASHMKRLFEPFFTTKAPGEGTGLGLSLARKIVLAHGGSIDVSSELGVGSTFTVRLPAHEVEQAGGAAARRESDVA